MLFLNLLPHVVLCVHSYMCTIICSINTLWSTMTTQNRRLMQEVIQLNIKWKQTFGSLFNSKLTQSTHLYSLGPTVLLVETGWRDTVSQVCVVHKNVLTLWHQPWCTVHILFLTCYPASMHPVVVNAFMGIINVYLLHPRQYLEYEPQHY
jgi:hypothetical protein